MIVGRSSGDKTNIFRSHSYYDSRKSNPQINRVLFEKLGSAKLSERMAPFLCISFKVDQGFLHIADIVHESIQK